MKLLEFCANFPTIAVTMAFCPSFFEWHLKERNFIKFRGLLKNSTIKWILDKLKRHVVPLGYTWLTSVFIYLLWQRALHHFLFGQDHWHYSYVGRFSKVVHQNWKPKLPILWQCPNASFLLSQLEFKKYAELKFNYLN